MLEDLKNRVRATQLRAARGASVEVLRLYWLVAKDILDRQHQHGWGGGRITPLAADLRVEFPEQRGWSRWNLHYMRAVAQAWTGAAQWLPAGPLTRLGDAGPVHVKLAGCVVCLACGGGLVHALLDECSYRQVALSNSDVGDGTSSASCTLPLRPDHRSPDRPSTTRAVPVYRVRLAGDGLEVASPRGERRATWLMTATNLAPPRAVATPSVGSPPAVQNYRRQRVTAGSATASRLVLAEGTRCRQFVGRLACWLAVLSRVGAVGLTSG